MIRLLQSDDCAIRCTKLTEINQRMTAIGSEPVCYVSQLLVNVISITARLVNDGLFHRANNVVHGRVATILRRIQYVIVRTGTRIARETFHFM